ncbi:MAG TPA: hypothetical protein VNL91_10865, partial [Thermoanaerobaculia bacterium]|nr:hypothetical protein [Thermoanaerobaculia bacterium]
GCPTAGPMLTGPPDGSSQRSRIVEFGWNPVPGAIAYELWAALDDGDFEFIGATSQTRWAELMPYGTIYWGVVAQFDGCDDTYSDVYRVEIPYDEECDRGEPYLISPPDGTEDVPTRVDFIWTPVYGASRYTLYIAHNYGNWSVAGTSTDSRITVSVPAGVIHWYVLAEFPDCPAVWSRVSSFESSATTQCRVPAAPELYVDPQATSESRFLLFWLPGLNTSSYEIQYSSQPNFATATTYPPTSEIYSYFTQKVSAPVRSYFRVRSLSSCGLGYGPYSRPAAIVVIPDTTTADKAEAAASYGTQNNVVQQVRIPGSGGTSGKFAQGVGFTAEVLEKWLTVRPSSGVIPPEGLTLEVIADPKTLPAGTSTGTVILRTTASSSHTTVPVSVNLVTPVTPSAGTGPTAASLIIPAVAHATGAGARFESDIRVTNTTSQAMKYLLNFTPTRSDGTKSGQQATIQIDAGETLALNDVLKNFFGFAAASDNAQGVLEIRPLASGNSATTPGGTFASSRTYAITPGGTYGQFIPAIRYSDFIEKGSGSSPILSLQQIARSASYRTNIGLVEASGNPASVLLAVYDAGGTKIGEMTRELKAGEHMQFPLEIPVENGRIAVSVTSPKGKVTAYASVLDNRTNDPLLVFPVNTGAVRANRYIVPGVAHIDTGAAQWRSDIRIFNGGSTRSTATLTFYPQAGSPGATGPRQVDVDPGEMKVLDNVLPSLFGVRSSGGSVVVTTPSDSKLVVTARTFNDTGSGTFGQFIPGVTIDEGVGMNEQALQILQVEESDRFYTNVGMVELTGNPAVVELSAYRPDSRVAVKMQVQLAPNQFLQIGHVLKNLGMNTTYNARVTLRVVGGSGRISGYGSLIDTRTGDPTYVPAQKDPKPSSSQQGLSLRRYSEADK